MLLTTILTLFAISQVSATPDQSVFSDDRVECGTDGPTSYPSVTFSLDKDFSTTWIKPATGQRSDVPGGEKDEVPLSIFRDRHSGRSGVSSASTALRPNVRVVPMSIMRPRSKEKFQAARMQSLHYGTTPHLDWDEVQMLAPDVSDRLTLLELAKMTGNAYAIEGNKNWYPIEDRWNRTIDFGWEEDDDGFRGHVFTSMDKSIVVMSIKGTTIINGPTTRKDKINDNRLFSCCCGRVDWSWNRNTVCDCYCGSGKCDNSCLHASLLEDSVFYNSGIELFNNITYMYPEANIWVVGHSLGGALASLIGSTFGVPVVAFESPGERMAAKRLHLPAAPAIPNIHSPVYHVYHNADPVPLGKCAGVLSSCSNVGYAMESRCHLGRSIVYDTVAKKGWWNSLTKHPIKVIINQVLNEDWESDQPVPEPTTEDNCVECDKWTFGNFKNVSVPEIHS